VIHPAVEAPRRSRRSDLAGAGDAGTLRGLASGLARDVAPALRRHWLIAVFVLLGIGMRVIVSLGYWPGIELYADSYDYLRVAHQVIPGAWHPSGYPLMLTVLSVTGSLGSVVIVQHLMGIAMGLLVYLLALRLGARRWLAALAALPVLLDGYQLALEQFILPETLTSLLLLGGLALLLWREQVGAWRGGAVGLLLAADTLTRTAVVPVLLVAGLYLLLRGGRWRGLVSYCAVAAVVLVAYGGWFAATYGYFGYSDYTGLWLYGRVAPFATCHYALPAREAELCPRRPVGKRSNNSEYFADQASSPINALRLGTRPRRSQLGESFAIAVIEHQPLKYAGAVLADSWHYFTPGRWMSSDIIDMQRWRFPPPHRNAQRGNYHVRIAREGFDGSSIKAAPNASLTSPLRTYQRYAYTPGPALLACLIAALVAAAGLLWRGTRRRHARWAALVLAASSLVLVLMPSLTVGFSYRYGLPLLVLLPPAGVVAADIGIDALMRRRRNRPSASTPRSAPMIPAGGSRISNGIPNR
jgi:hypothetical protein